MLVTYLLYNVCQLMSHFLTCLDEQEKFTYLPQSIFLGGNGKTSRKKPNQRENQKL